jgi:NAD(P)-dependent dehydrogenase (short-subunit alcohol dehydrogenase family)
MPKTIVITGASSGFGASSARHLADAGHTVYAGIRGTTGKNTQAVADATAYATEHHVELRPI